MEEGISNKLFFDLGNLAIVSGFEPFCSFQAVTVGEMCFHGMLGDFNDVSASVAFDVAYQNSFSSAQAQRLMCHTDDDCCADG